MTEQTETSPYDLLQRTSLLSDGGPGERGRTVVGYLTAADVDAVLDVYRDAPSVDPSGSLCLVVAASDGGRERGRAEIGYVSPEQAQASIEDLLQRRAL